MAGLDPLRALTPGVAVAPVDSDARTAAEQKLAMLLAKQAELANAVTDAGTHAMEVVNQIAALSNEPQGAQTKSPMRPTCSHCRPRLPRPGSLRSARPKCIAGTRRC